MCRTTFFIIPITLVFLLLVTKQYNISSSDSLVCQFNGAGSYRWTLLQNGNEIQVGNILRYVKFCIPLGYNMYG